MSPRQLVAIVPSSPLDDFNRIYTTLLTAIDVSQRYNVWITMAYFAPTQDMIRPWRTPRNAVSMCAYCCPPQATSGPCCTQGTAVHRAAHSGREAL